MIRSSILRPLVEF